MVICDFYIECVSFLPPEADSPLIVNPDAVLTLAVAAQFLQMIAAVERQNSEITRSMQHLQLSPCLSLNHSEADNRFVIEHILGVLVSERADRHGPVGIRRATYDVASQTR